MLACKQTLVFACACILMDVVIKYFRMMDIVPADSQVVHVRGVTHISCCGLLGNVTNLKIVLVSDMKSFSELGVTPTATDAVVIVANNYEHVHELLIYNNTNVMELMNSNVLIIHILGVRCAMSNIYPCSIVYIQCDENESVNRRRVLITCSDPSTEYINVPPRVSSSIEKPTNIYYSRFVNPLEQFGVNYIYVVFRAKQLLLLETDKLLYVVRSSTAVSVSTCVYTTVHDLQ